MGDDWKYMHRCIELAKLGEGDVAPNPMVGAVLVYDDRIIGEGYHRKYGQAHAEVNCIRDAETRSLHGHPGGNNIAALLEKSCMYVSLEPCAHFGKTPPCADLIIQKKIPKVMIGCADPFKEVDGKGIKKLQAAGVEVHSGILEEECKALNKRFFTFHARKRPYIILKWAQSAGAKISNTGNSRLIISNEITNRNVHKWRSQEAAIMVGTTTASNDDPSLTNRLWSGNNPVRLVLDMNLRLSTSLHIFNGEADTIIFNGFHEEKKEKILHYKIVPAQPLIPQIMNALYELNIQSVLVEGGAKLIQSFIDEDTWDEARVITNNDLAITHGTNAPQLTKAALVEKFTIYSDTICFFHPVPG